VHIKQTATLLGLVLGVAACVRSESPVDVQGLDLLRRRPDRVVEQPGVRRPSYETSWGADREYGWMRWGEKRQGKPFVWSRQREAHLALECISSKDRTLVLRAWKPEGTPRNFEACVSLNGIEIGCIALEDRPTNFTLEVAAPAWRAGRNRLAIEVPHTVNRDDGQKLGFALAEVRYDEESLVELDHRKRELGLHGGTAVSYVSEPLTDQRLYLKGRAHGRGELAIGVHRLDRDGERTEEILRQHVRLDGDTLVRSLDLPVGRDRYEVELAFAGNAQAHFDFQRLELREETAPERFPVVFISIDTLSARHLSVYGYDRPTSPNLERFAEDAIVFEHCMSNTTWTLPSYMSQMTGLYPYSHRLYPGRQAEMWELWHLSDNRWTLAELLRAAGHATAGFVDNDWITERFGLDQGFDHFDASAAVLPVEDPEGGIHHVAERAEAWLEEFAADEPFFLFLHAFDVHGPYTADPAHRGTFRQNLDLTAHAPAGGDVAYGIIPTYVAETITPEHVPPTLPTAPLAAAYDEVIRMVDTRLGRFFERLRELGLYEKSLILVSADHGETMANADLLFGHGVLDQDVVHVPLLVKLPGNDRAGTRVSRPVQLVDIYPTILERMGRVFSSDLHGRSLLTSAGTDRVLLSEGGAMQQAALFEGRWKLVEKCLGKDSTHAILISAPHQTLEWAQRKRDELSARGVRRALFRWMDDEILAHTFFFERYRTGLTEELHRRMRTSSEYEHMIRFLRKANDESVYELYDLEADPRARNDLAARHPGRVEALKGKLRAEQARRDRAQKSARPPQAPPALGVVELERLKALGYLGE